MQIHYYDVIKFYLRKRTWWCAFKGFVKTKHLSLYLLMQLHFMIENAVVISSWALNRIPCRCGRDDVQIHH
jgi:hypothetical protein